MTTSAKEVVGAIKWLIVHHWDGVSADELIDQIDLLMSYIYEEAKK